MALAQQPVCRPCETVLKLPPPGRLPPFTNENGAVIEDHGHWVCGPGLQA